jgi:hypothetical protein
VPKTAKKIVRLQQLRVLRGDFGAGPWGLRPAGVPVAGDEGVFEAAGFGFQARQPSGGGGASQIWQYRINPHAVVPVLDYPMSFFAILGF